VLINLVSIHPTPSPQSVPLAAAFLKAYAQPKDISISLVDFFIGDNPAACAARLTDPLPRAIGFSLYVWNRDLCCSIAAAVRRCFPDILLFCGGPEVTAAPESIMRSGLFDGAIIGEGEILFSTLCQSLACGGDFSGIHGMKLPGAPATSLPSPIADLDSIPSPYLTGVIDTGSCPGLLWQLSRGCSFTCDFCFDSRGIHGVRHFSLERVESELRHFAKTGVRQIFVLDSTFNLNQKRAKAILRMIKKIAPDIHFHFEVRNEFIDREMAHLFSQIACSLQIGLQSADKDVLKLVGRSFNMADFTAKVGLLNDCGAVFGFDLIYGLPGDSLDRFRQSLNYALSLYPNHLDIFPLAVLPGTALAMRGNDHGLKWSSKPPYILESTDSFSSTDMATAAGLATACDIFYTRGRAVAWFNAVVTALGMKPAEVLQKFSLWLSKLKGQRVQESDLNDEEIGELQRSFLTRMFQTKKTIKYLPLVLDLQNYHHQYAAALLSPDPELSAHQLTPETLSTTTFKLAPSVRIVSFRYEIEELLDCGEPRIAWMYVHLPQSGSQAVIYTRNGTVCTESLAPPYILLLEQIGNGIGRISPAETELTDDETREFILFALQEGIIMAL
jgi:radical SAM superfamily enzyme YgiQ (UPF0313 family)